MNAGEQAGWRPMRPGDLDAAMTVAAVVHPTLPEDRTVFADRLVLAPAWCRVLERDGRVAGYLVAHPWRDAAPPPLDTVLGTLPQAATAFCLHDLALLPEVRGGGAATVLVRTVLAEAAMAGFGTAVLVAVGASNGFWARFGFEPVASASSVVGYGPGSMAMRCGLHAD